MLKENIARLSEHAEVVKRQNTNLFNEMEEMVNADEYVREQLKRADVLNRLKQRNTEELARSMRQVDLSRSMEMQREMAFRNQENNPNH